MPASVAATRERVERLLARLIGRIEVGPEGEFSFPYESTRVFIRVLPWQNDTTVVNVFAITNMDVPPSPELFRHIATENSWIFGSLSAQEAEGTVTVLFSHSLLGEFFDPEELRTAVAAVASTADQVDDEIKDRFGGLRFVDSPG